MKNSVKKRIGVLMGGPSRERDISIKSGKAVCRALESNGIKPVPLELIKASTMNGYRDQVSDMIRLSDIDVAFIALHGEFGEDGCVQEVLEGLNIPYTGSRVKASTLGMDKVSSKAIFESKGILTPRYKVITLANESGKDLALPALIKELGLPLVVKPSNEGSSIGLSIVESENGFIDALNNALEHSDKVIIEEYIAGREITVGILEDRPLPVVEIIPGKRFFDFEAKYKKGMTEYRTPADIEQKAYRASQEIALESHRALGARFFSRVDMILTEDNIPVVLEVNTIPGLTETSLLPKAAQAAGIDFNKLVIKILESALW
ncbi:MAG: D-alanine--D-alanine ligase [Candidatus Omnitrophica bacterium]|nr:D-alanine--D-alanine ligase [Candidatus Omnitrophota bacterium]